MYVVSVDILRYHIHLKRDKIFLSQEKSWNKYIQRELLDIRYKLRMSIHIWFNKIITLPFIYYPFDRIVKANFFFFKCSSLDSLAYIQAYLSGLRKRVKKQINFKNLFFGLLPWCNKNVFLVIFLFCWRKYISSIHSILCLRK